MHSTYLGTGPYERHRIRERASLSLLMQITRRVISSTSAHRPASLAISLFLTRLGVLPPSPRVREFSWLAELTAFGKIGSYPHRVRSVTRWFAPQEALPAAPVRSYAHVMCAYTTTETRARTNHAECLSSGARRARCTASPTAPSWITKSLPLLELVRTYA